MSDPLETSTVDAGHTSAEKAGAIKGQDRSAFVGEGDRVVDEETIVQLLDQLEEQAGLGDRELEQLLTELEEKRETFADLLDRAPELSRRELDFLLRNVFATRQRRDAMLSATGERALNEAIEDLLAGDAAIAERFDSFCDRVEGADERVVRSLAAELLHHTDPATYPLWTRWMWHPASQTGAVTLVTMNDVDLDGETPGETYELVAEAVDRLDDRKGAIGFDTTVLSGPLGTDVALATIHAAYTYLVLGMRMTKEFTEAIPDHPEYVRRLLGIQELHERRQT